MGYKSKCAWWVSKFVKRNERKKGKKKSALAKKFPTQRPPAEFGTSTVTKRKHACFIAKALHIDTSLINILTGIIKYIYGNVADVFKWFFPSLLCVSVILPDFNGSKASGLEYELDPNSSQCKRKAHPALGIHTCRWISIYFITTPRFQLTQVGGICLTSLMFEKILKECRARALESPVSHQIGTRVNRYKKASGSMAT